MTSYVIKNKDKLEISEIEPILRRLYLNLDEESEQIKSGINRLPSPEDFDKDLESIEKLNPDFALSLKNFYSFLLNNKDSIDDVYAAAITKIRRIILDSKNLENILDQVKSILREIRDNPKIQNLKVEVSKFISFQKKYYSNEQKELSLGAGLISLYALFLAILPFLEFLDSSGLTLSEKGVTTEILDGYLVVCLVISGITGFSAYLFKRRFKNFIKNLQFETSL